MAIKTPSILPGEKGYVSKRERTVVRKAGDKLARRVQRKKDMRLGKIKSGHKSFRIGKPKTTPRKIIKYPIWRYSKRIGEIIVIGKDADDEHIEMTFNRLGGVGNYKHLIQDSDFQLAWAIREQELLITQKNCNLCYKKLSKTAIPNLYHIKMWKKRTKLLEDASKVPGEVVSGKLSIEKGWEKFNDILEGNLRKRNFKNS